MFSSHKSLDERRCLKFFQNQPAQALRLCGALERWSTQNAEASRQKFVDETFWISVELEHLISSDVRRFRGLFHAETGLWKGNSRTESLGPERCEIKEGEFFSWNKWRAEVPVSQCAKTAKGKPAASFKYFPRNKIEVAASINKEVWNWRSTIYRISLIRRSEVEQEMTVDILISN